MDDIKIGEILEPEDDTTHAKNEREVETKFWTKVRKAANRIPFMDEVVASYFCAMDPETPTRVRGILLAALAYFILPLDSLPDFIFGLGFTDDIAVLSAAFAAVRGNVTDAHRAAARNALRDGPDAPDKPRQYENEEI